LAFLGDGYLNLTAPQKFWIGVGIAVIWGFVGIYLGKNHEKLELEAKLKSDETSQEPVKTT